MSDEETEKENWRLTVELARSAHERDREDSRRMFGTVVEFAIFAMRTASLLSGGAVVVSLAFVGGLYSSEKELAIRMLLPVILFSLGAVMGGLGSALGYIAQYRYQEASVETTYHWEMPFVRSTERQPILIKKGIYWHNWCMVFIGMSYILILVGVAASYLAIKG